MNNPLVSIIVPVYNVQNSVAACLSSILAQSWKEIEVIVLNDGSTDNSYSICEEFRKRDPRIILIDKANAGLSMTRNVGMEMARGKYIQFVDSDDLLEPDFTENLVRAAESSDADLVISPYWMAIPADAVRQNNKAKLTAEAKMILDDPSVIERCGYLVRKYDFLPAGIYDQRSYAAQLIEKPATFYFNVVWNKLYRRQLLEDLDLWFTNELLYAEDQQFNVRYLENVRSIISIDRPGYFYVQNPQGICHTQVTPTTVMQNRLQMFRYYKELFTKLGIYDEAQPKLYRSLFAFSENVSASTLLQRAIDDAASYWSNIAGDDPSAALADVSSLDSVPAKPARTTRKKKLDPKPE